MKKILMAMTVALLCLACKEKPEDYELISLEEIPDFEYKDGELWIVESEKMRLQTGTPVASVTEEASSDAINVDTSQLVTPLPSGAVLDLGTLRIDALADADLNRCGFAKNEPCGRALIIVYTTTATGGFEVARAGEAYKSIGVGRARATVLDKIVIPAGKASLSLSDFANTAYAVRMNAGAQAYDTDLVVEYVLAP